MRIVAVVDNGGDINELIGGASYLHEYLDTYYQSHIYRIDACEKDDECEDAPFSDELKLPLDKRSSNVSRHLDWFMENGADPNAGEKYYPLMRGVGNADAAMTEYLLSHGADPFYDEREGDIPYGGGNWYIDELDTTMLHESFVTKPDITLFDAILQTAAVLAKYGVTNSGDYCIRIDAETRTVTATQAKVKF